jgi:2-polyprenyl-3-methyl-5-hydroxy-6-metoxy-1,4-benzoquinol methylase
MRNQQILLREQHEREAFSKVATEGRTAVSDEAQLTIPESTIERYGRALRGQSPPTTPLEQMFSWLGPKLEGKRILEICCHDGEFGAILARLGGTVDSVDIAEPLVEQARHRAALNGVSHLQTPVVMSVHDMTFADGTFDVVFGKASLHHLDVIAARDEIFRVLKPGGIGVFSEPVALSPVLTRLRNWVPVKRDVDSPDEKALSETDMNDFCRPFQGRTEVYSRMLGRLERIVPAAKYWLRDADRRLLEAAPGLRRAAGCCTFSLRK